MSTDDKRSPPRHLAIASLAEVLPSLNIPQLSDEEWAARDAKIAADRAQSEDAGAAAQRQAREDELHAAGFPRRAIDKARAADENRPAVIRVKGWNTDEDSCLVISGTHGCGKTVASTWWALRRRPTPQFVRASTFAASSRYDRDTRSGWLSAPALVLDDLGSEFSDVKGSFLVDLDELMDVFYGDHRPLLITTNAEMPEFKSRYGVRIVDRLRECGSWFSVIGGSLR
jgi:hypothetical protein